MPDHAAPISLLPVVAQEITEELPPVAWPVQPALLLLTVAEVLPDSITRIFVLPLKAIAGLLPTAYILPPVKAAPAEEPLR